MSVERVVAAPFKHAGREHLSDQEFVVALSLHRDWFSPAQARQVIDIGVSDDLLERRDDGVVPTFDPASVTIPTGFTPDESMLVRRSPFERILERLLEAGEDKRAAVGEINRLQQELDITIDAAAAIYASRRGIDVREEAGTAAQSLLGTEI